MERFDPSDFLRLVEEHRVTHTQVVPTMFVRMLKLDEAERTRHDLSSLQVCIHAAAPCPIPVKEQMIEWWGPKIYEYYAGTEGNGFCAITSEEWLSTRARGQAARRRAAHPRRGRRGAPPGEPGPSTSATAAASSTTTTPRRRRRRATSRGWSTLGDIGYVDEDGYLYLTDRKSYMIISGGVNIYPQEAENVLTMHPR
jgi:acyl-CoA synthetase (AMP-forming)/AMP-acid ligase II